MLDLKQLLSLVISKKVNITKKKYLFQKNINQYKNLNLQKILKYI